jgi:hypothetical protein
MNRPLSRIGYACGIVTGGNPAGGRNLRPQPVNPSPSGRAVVQDNFRCGAHKLAPLGGFGHKALNFIQDSQITRGVPQLKDFAANPSPFSVRSARCRVVSYLDQFRGDFCFPSKPRAKAFQVMMQLEAAPQRAVNKQ